MFSKQQVAAIVPSAFWTSGYFILACTCEVELAVTPRTPLTEEELRRFMHCRRSHHWYVAEVGLVSKSSQAKGKAALTSLSVACSTEHCVAFNSRECVQEQLREFLADE